MPHDWRWNAYWPIVPPALGLAVDAMTTGWDSMNWMFVALGGNLSNHLAKLEEAGYVEVEKTYKGKIPLTVLRLTRQGKAAFERYKKTLNGVLAKTDNR